MSVNEPNDGNAMCKEICARRESEATTFHLWPGQCSDQLSDLIFDKSDTFGNEDVFMWLHTGLNFKVPAIN